MSQDVIYVADYIYKNDVIHVSVGDKAGRRGRGARGL